MIIEKIRVGVVILMGIAIALVPIVIIILVVAAVLGAKGSAQGNKGGDGMIKTVYVYLVLFATLMMVIGGSVAAFMAIADIVSPAGYYQSFEEYQRILKDSGQTSLSEDQIKKNYDIMAEAEKQRVHENAFNSLIKSLGWIVIPAPVFLYFQFKVRKAT